MAHFLKRAHYAHRRLFYRQPHRTCADGGHYRQTLPPPLSGVWRRLGGVRNAGQRSDAQEYRKTLHRSDFADEGGIVAVQIAGSDPEQMADAARYNVGLGAQVIDINMGCPAKKVCNVQAGSALMQDEPLVAAILEAVVKAAGVPVTLKTRLGWHDDHQNLPAIAKIAEDCGIAALAVHGRARTQMYKGEARYELIAETKSRLNIPVWVNGDITSPQKPPPSSNKPPPTAS